MNKISDFIKNKAKKNFPFVPSREFYLKTGIGQKRFWQLYRDEKSPTLNEIQALSKYFDVSANNFCELES